MFKPLHMVLFLIAALWLIVCVNLSGQYIDIPWIEDLGWIGFCSFLIFWLVSERRNIKILLNRTRTQYSMLQFVSAMCCGLLVLGLVVLSQRPSFDLVWDVTFSQRESLTDRTLEVLKELESRGVTISARAWLTHSQPEDELRALIRRYQRNGAKFDFSVADPQIQAVAARADGVREEAVLILETGGESKKQRKIWVFNEHSVTRALRELLADEEKTIWFVQGHGEPGLDDSGPEGLSKLVDLYKEAGIRSDKINLSEVGDIPEDIEMLLLVNPEYNLNVLEIKLLKRFLVRGGVFAIFIGAMRPADSLNTLLSEYDLKIEDNFVVLPPEDPRVKLLGQNTALASEFSAFHPLTHLFSGRSDFSLYLSDTRSIAVIEGLPKKSESSELLIRTSGDNIAINDVYEEDDLKNIGPDRVVKGPFGVLGLSHVNGNNPGERIGRILAFGSASLLLNHSLNKNGHSNFAQNLAGYMSDDAILMAADKDQRKIEKGLHIQKASSVWLLFGLSFAYPSFMLVGGFYVWHRRKKQ